MSERLYFPTFTRHLSILLVVQSLAGSTSAVAFLVSGFAGTSLAPVRILATLPMSAFVIGVAISSSLAAWTMSRAGRKTGHLIGASIGFSGAACACVALTIHSFWGYSASCVMLGVGTAFNNQVRFTAAEGAPPAQKGLVHSWILMCGIFAAILGPAVAAYGRKMDLFGGAAEYAGSYVLLMVMLLASISLLAFLPSLGTTTQTASDSGKISFRHVLSKPVFWVAATSGTTSFAVMTLLMSATPMQMTMIEHFSQESAVFTIQSHIVAMFLPSLFSGFFVRALGLRRLIYCGLLIFALCVPVAYFAGSLHGYWWALVLLGIGWNFLFLAGSTLLSLSFSGPDRFAAQGLNDTMVFGTQAMASLAAGWLLYTVGWQSMVLIPIPFLVLVLALVIGFGRKVI
ncbi:MAG TPA: hypothetical protein PKE49_01030 [Leptospiraceae bacterium]|nr:hypothetical protein [Leptospirales bacterium]HMU82438.1 hypothetical protein [Leptospiraceae bacterium]HMW59308.1 hypothetical protein [Leptospiraceae bacterium]HMX55069.1 hypothetical protein [Leptospiraceae bacterium]HMY44453.1 hypothetical protein [Leptospiraceae bacterium]